jgi:hypothetical protein
MPIQHTIDHEARLVRARSEGTVSRHDVEAFLDSVIVADALPYAKLYDGRHGTDMFAGDDLLLLGARLAAYATLGRRGPLALVAAPHQIDNARRLRNLDPDDHAVGIFGDPADAEAWLRAQAAR